MTRKSVPYSCHRVGSGDVINSKGCTLSIEAKAVISDGYP